MKKITTLLLTVLMLVVVFASCNEAPVDTSNSSSEAESSQSDNGSSVITDESSQSDDGSSEIADGGSDTEQIFNPDELDIPDSLNGEGLEPEKVVFRYSEYLWDQGGRHYDITPALIEDALDYFEDFMQLKKSDYRVWDDEFLGISFERGAPLTIQSGDVTLRSSISAPHPYKSISVKFTLDDYKFKSNRGAEQFTNSNIPYLGYMFELLEFGGKDLAMDYRTAYDGDGYVCIYEDTGDKALNLYSSEKRAIYIHYEETKPIDTLIVKEIVFFDQSDLDSFEADAISYEEAFEAVKNGEFIKANWDASIIDSFDDYEYYGCELVFTPEINGTFTFEYMFPAYCFYFYKTGDDEYTELYYPMFDTEEVTKMLKDKGYPEPEFNWEFLE